MKIEYEYECTLSILIENQPSILPRITGLLTRRGFKIDSLAIGSTENEKTSRITLTLLGNLRIIDQITRQFYKLLPVLKIQNLTHIPSIQRELILLKILSTSTERSRILEITTFFRARVLDFAEKSLTLEVTGDSEKIIALEQLINKFGILEVVRTGKVALSRESIANGQLFTISKNIDRRKLLNSYISEIETKFYLK